MLALNSCLVGDQDKKEKKRRKKKSSSVSLADSLVPIDDASQVRDKFNPAGVVSAAIDPCRPGEYVADPVRLSIV